MNKKRLQDLNLHGQKVLMRVDFNVPIENGVIQSDKRIVAALPSIQEVAAKGGRVILLSHLGRIKTIQDKAKNSLFPVAQKLQELINQSVLFVDATRGPQVEQAINNLKNGEILMLQNTRYEDLENKAESKNSNELGAYWASLGDVFINDAFGTAHRAHASNVGIASNIETSAIGFLVQKELEMLGQGLNNPQHPFVAIIGGAKVSDKITVIENLLKKADKVLIGGGMAYTFLKALGHEVGTSLLEPDYISTAKKILDLAQDKIVLPIDIAYSDSFADNSRQEIKWLDLEKNMMGLDIGSQTIALYQKALQGAKTVIWNGPMGVAEFNNFKEGTEAIATTIANQNGIFSIIGGGDSAAAAIKLGFENKFTHISTGGGASLQYLEGKPLPGIEAIQNQE